MAAQSAGDRKKMLTTARQRWAMGASATDKQRTREKDDLRFLVDHWPSDIRTAREAGTAVQGMPPVPARPCIQVDKLSEPINRVLNQERQADIGIQVVPADDFGELGIELDETEIEVREGLTRRIQRAPEADDARTWGFKRATQAGQGYYLVNTRFLPGKSWDKEIYLHRVFDQNHVVLDPAHEQPTGSDAEWEFIGAWVSWDAYKAKHPSRAKKRNKLTDATENEFTEYANQQPNWVNVTEGARAVFVVDYWRAEYEQRTTLLLNDGSSVWKDDLPAGFNKSLIVDERDESVRTIHYCQLDGINDEPLDEAEWEGPDMPIVKIVGEEIQPYDGERRIQGMVRPARDSQFGLDAMISKQVETVALTPLPALHVDPEAIAGYEPWYQYANTRTLPFLPSRTYDDSGRQLAPPQRLNADPNLLPIAQSIALFAQGIQDTTATSDPALGRTDPSVKSAKHAQALIDEATLSTSQYLDNLQRSLRYEGQIINNLLFPIYGKRPGRIVRIMTGEGEQEQRTLNPPTPQDAQNQQIAEKTGVLTEHAKFNVAIKLTKNSTLKRDAESSFVGALLEANPVFMTWFGDLFFKNQDGPGHEQMAERAKAMLDPKIQQMLADKDKGVEIPPEAQQKIADLTAQLQHAEMAMQELEEEARGKKIESETKIKIAAMDSKVKLLTEKLNAKTDMEKTREDNATKIHIAQIAAKAKGIQMAHEAETEAKAMAHEVASSEVQSNRDTAAAQADREHDVAMTGAQSDTDVEQAEIEREASAEEAEAGRAHEATLTQAQLDAQAEQSEASE